MDVTVAICTYNGANRVPEVLDHLNVQEHVDSIEWEVLVVDNNSTDNTQDVVEAHLGRVGKRAPLRYVCEKQVGKSNAMRRAVEEARGKWIAFLDDDNLPAPDWVVSVFQFGRKHPRAGIFGGQVHGLFEDIPPKTFGVVQPLFAINERKEKVCYSAGGQLEFAAPGAGLVVKKKAWKESVPENGLELSGPTGSERGVLGEEFELQWRVYQNGWEVWHNPSMHLDHKIPAERLEEEYLQGFFKAIGLSRHHTRMMRFESWQRPFMTVAYWWGDVWKILRLVWKYRTKIFLDRFVGGRARMRLYMLIAPFRLN